MSTWGQAFCCPVLLRSCTSLRRASLENSQSYFSFFFSLLSSRNCNLQLCQCRLLQGRRCRVLTSPQSLQMQMKWSALRPHASERRGKWKQKCVLWSIHRGQSEGRSFHSFSCASAEEQEEEPDQNTMMWCCIYQRSMQISCEQVVSSFNGNMLEVHK